MFIFSLAFTRTLDLLTPYAPYPGILGFYVCIDIFYVCIDITYSIVGILLFDVLNLNKLFTCLINLSYGGTLIYCPYLIYKHTHTCRNSRHSTVFLE